jgi:glycosyltransferase involved in cell wall biosynthesis
MTTVPRGARSATDPPPKVSVFVLTHDHVGWIGQALESALAQEAPFEFELLVADDCSTDGTREIVRDYADRHPDAIRTFLPDRNLGVAGIWLQAARQCRGEYIAILEGDDYWTSAAKLARQVALLDARPGWSSCFHRATLFHEDGRPSRPATPAFDREVFELDDLIRACFIPFLTVMFRRDVLASVPEWVFSYRWFDWLFHLFCARRGPIGFLDEDMAAYRVHAGGNWSAQDRTSQLEEDLKVYERLAAEIPQRRPLIESCVENRHCQIAVEAAGVPAQTAVAVVEPRRETPVYFNGREAVSLSPQAPGARAPGGVAALAGFAGKEHGDAAGSLHYPPREAPREPPPRPRCACVVPRSADEALERDEALLRLLNESGESVWADDWCRIWEVDVDSAASAGQREGKAARDMGALVEIAEVSLPEPLPAELLGGFIDEPRAGAVLDAKAIDVLGWALGAERDATAVEFAIGDEVFWRAPLRSERPDLAEAFPEQAAAGRAGFRTTLNVIGTPADFELSVSVVLKGQRRVQLGTIRGRHRWRRDRSPAYAELVSVVIPCFGQSHYLGDAIESVLAQTYPHLEILVVDDGSADNTSAIASRYPGVKCLRAENSGVAAARNLGLRSTNGDFLVFLDADDRLLPAAVEAGLRALEDHPECAAAVGAYRRVSHDGKPIETHDQPAVERDQFTQLLQDNWAGFPARAIYRRAVFEHVRGFDSMLSPAEDFALNLEIARQFPLWSHTQLVAEHREHGRNSSADAATMLTQTLAAVRRQRKHLRRSPESRRAYRAAKWRWKTYYGGLLARQAAESWSERRLGDAMRETASLARHHPRGLVRIVRPDPSLSG